MEVSCSRSEYDRRQQRSPVTDPIFLGRIRIDPIPSSMTVVIAAECDVYLWDICGGAMQVMEMCVDCNDDWLCSIQCSVSPRGCLIAHSVLAH